MEPAIVLGDVCLAGTSSNRRGSLAALGALSAAALKMTAAVPAWCGPTRVARRFQALPPFWIAFGYMVTVGLSQTMLALPIAVAGTATTTAVLLVVACGVLNLVTVAAMAEAFGRSERVRSGSGFYGRVVADYLGATGSLLLSGTLGFRAFMFVLSSLLGLSTALATLTPVPPMMWAGLLLAGGLCLSVRGSFALSTSLTVGLGALSMGLVLTLSLLALLHGQPAIGQPLAPAAFAASGGTSLLGAIMGVYIGHSYIAQCARLVLPRDPGAGAFIGGSAAATVAMMLIALVWVVAVGEAVPPALLLGQLGTPLAALSAVMGPAARGLGAVLVLLLLGLAFVRQAPILYGLVREWLPATSGLGWIAVGPLLLAGVGCEWMLATGASSFASLTSLTGLLSLPLIAGVLPMLLLLASRRRGDYQPLLAPRLLEHPVLVGAVCTGAVGLVFAHALVSGQGPVERLAALGVGLATLVGMARIWRQGAFRLRLVVDLGATTHAHGPYVLGVNRAADLIATACSRGRAWSAIGRRTRGTVAVISADAVTGWR